MRGPPDAARNLCPLRHRISCVEVDGITNPSMQNFFASLVHLDLRGVGERDVAVVNYLVIWTL